MPLEPPGSVAARSPGTPRHGHRQKIAFHPLQSCDEESIVASGVARKVNREEWLKEPRARAAMDKECDKMLNCERPDPWGEGKRVC